MPGEDLQTKIYRYLTRYCVTSQTTTGQTPAKLLMKHKPCFLLDVLHPSLSNKVIDRQSSARRYHQLAVSPHGFYVGDAVLVVNFAGMPKWIFIS